MLGVCLRHVEFHRHPWNNGQFFPNRLLVGAHMIEYTITDVRRSHSVVAVTYTAGDPDKLWELHMPLLKLDAFTAEYGITDPLDALDAIVHAAHIDTYLSGLDPRDDPATVAGWVTTNEPDAEPVLCYNARSTADAGGALLARLDATKAGHALITDPQGLLALAVPLMADPGRCAQFREQVDVSRWLTVYGDLPLPEPDRPAAGRIPLQARG